MAKSSNRSHSSGLEPLGGIPQQVLAHLFNSIAFGEYADCCSIEDIAAHLGKKPGSIRRAVATLVKKGYATTHGEILEIVYPTAAAIRRQDSSLSDVQAKAILQRIRRQ